MTLKEYMRELILMDKQYGLEEELYPLINMLLRECCNVEKLSVRDVHNSKATGMTHDMLYGYASFPDLVILDEAYKPPKLDDNKEKQYQHKLMYGCVEIKKTMENLLDFNLDMEIEIPDYYYAIVISKIPVDTKNQNQAQYLVKIKKDCKNIDDLLKKYKEYDSINISLLKELTGVIEVKKCHNGQYKDKSLITDERVKSVPSLIGMIKNNKEWNQKIEMRLNNEKFDTQLMGELLWYGKVIYTNGLVWKYLQLKKAPDWNALENCIGPKGESWVKKLKSIEFKIEFKCDVIGNISEAYNNLMKEPEENKLDSLKKRFYLRDSETYGWEQEWDRLKYNLACINWKGENTYNQFITKRGYSEE